MNLPAFSVRNTIVGNMLTVVVLVCGIMAAQRMNREVFPVVELDIVILTTTYPGASPEEVEELVTLPIEEELDDIEDIDEVISTSMEALSLIMVQIDPDAKDSSRTISEIERVVDQLNRLPEDAEEPEIDVVTTHAPSMHIGVAGNVPEQELQAFAERMAERLERLPGVSTVEKQGWRDEEFWVEADPERLRVLDLALADVVRALALRNVNRAGGKLQTSEGELIVRTIGQFHSEREIEAVIVRSNVDGDHVRVGDVAHVRRTFEEHALYTRANAMPAIILAVKKKKSADTVALSDAAQAFIASQRGHLPEGLHLFVIDDESFYVKRRLHILTSNGMIGMVLVTFCLFIFLNVRVALITAIGIPFSFLGALIVMQLCGVTMNMMTMFGLILVLGMVVDDAIIVGENIFRHMEMGVAPRKAAVRGTMEVIRPVVATVLTTVAAFLPMYFAPDLYGKFLKWLPVVVILCLVASLLEVLIVMPAHAADFARPFARKRQDGHTHLADHPWMSMLQSVYIWVLGKALRWRYIFLTLCLGSLACCVYRAYPHLKVDIFPPDLIDVLYVRFTGVPQASLGDTERIVRELETRMQTLPEEELEKIVAYVGGHIDLRLGGFSSRGPQYGSFMVYLTPQNTRMRKTQAIVNELRARCQGIEGIIQLEWEMVEPGPPVGKPVEARITGQDYPTMRRLSEEMQAYLERVDGVADVQDDFAAGKREAHIMVKQEEASRLGLSVQAIAETIRAAFGGIEATHVREGDEELAVRVRLGEPHRHDLDQVPRLTVPNATGRLIPLGGVVEVQQREGLPAIRHVDGQRSITVSAVVDSEVVSAAKANAALLQAVQDIPVRYPGCEVVGAGEWKETQKIVQFMIRALIAAILIIYAILVVQFNSFFQPLVLLPTIPLSLVGVMIALLLHGKSVSIMAMMGMVGLGGVVINDAIVFVSFVNDRRREGRGVKAALLDGGLKRLRPILLTSVTTISGLMPVIYGWGGYEPFIAPAAIALAYGLGFSTILTLLIVPCFYHVAHDVKQLLRKVLFLIRFRSRNERV